MANERSSDFLFHWLNTIEALGFAFCILVFALAIYHIYFERNVTGSRQQQRIKSPRQSKKKQDRGHNHKLDPIIKYLALISILLFGITCITNTFAKQMEQIPPYMNRVCFVSTQICWALATITSYCLFIRQLYIIYNRLGFKTIL